MINLPNPRVAIEIRKQAKADGDAARMMAEDGERPEVGGLYTLSPDFVCGDRSYTHTVWEVVAINNAHARVRFAGGERPYRREELIISINERSWYPANDFGDPAQ